MYEPRPKMTADSAVAVEHLTHAQPNAEDCEAYFIAQDLSLSAGLPRALSPLEQMYAYYDEA
jgi:hypothetical protein